MTAALMNRRSFLSSVSVAAVVASASSKAFAFPQTYDTDASVYFAQLVINGAATLTAQFKAAVNAYIIAEKAALNWGNQDAEYIFATTDIVVASTNLAQPPLYGITWTGSPTFTVQTGLNGNSSTIFGDLNVNESALTRLAQNNAHVDVWTNSSNVRRAAGLAGVLTGLQVDPQTNKVTVLTSPSGNAITDTGGGTAGLHYADRTSSSTLNTGLNGAAQTTAGASTSSAPSANHIVVCEINATTCANGINELFFGIGGPMNSESSHYTNVRNLLLALGVTGI